MASQAMGILRGLAGSNPSALCVVVCAVCIALVVIAGFMTLVVKQIVANATVVRFKGREAEFQFRDPKPAK